MPTSPWKHATWLAGAALLVMLTTGGCHRPFTPAPSSLAIDAAEYDRMFLAGAQVLRDHGFRVDRQDRRFGLLSTHPLDAPTAVEPWRTSNTTAGQAWQATLDHMRRTVNVMLEPIEHDDDVDDESRATLGDYTLRVEVLLERRTNPTRRLTGTSQRNAFSRLSDVPAEWSRRGIAGSYWEPVGRDAYLEQRLIRAIVDRAMQPAYAGRTVAR